MLNWLKENKGRQLIEFKAESETLTAADVMALIRPRFTQTNANIRELQQCVWSNFEHFLLLIERE